MSYDGGERAAPRPTRAKARIPRTEREGDAVRPDSWPGVRVDTNLRARAEITLHSSAEPYHRDVFQHLEMTRDKYFAVW